MYSCFPALSQILVKNFFGKVFFLFLFFVFFVLFFNFGHLTIFAKWIFLFWLPFWNKTFLSFFLQIYDCFRCKHNGASFVPKFQQKRLTNGWVRVDTPCAQTGVKSSIGTEVLNYSKISISPDWFYISVWIVRWPWRRKTPMQFYTI